MHSLFVMTPITFTTLFKAYSMDLKQVLTHVILLAFIMWVFKYINVGILWEYYAVWLLSLLSFAVCILEMHKLKCDYIYSLCWIYSVCMGWRSFLVACITCNMTEPAYCSLPALFKFTYQKSKLQILPTFNIARVSLRERERDLIYRHVGLHSFQFACWF